MVIAGCSAGRAAEPVADATPSAPTTPATSVASSAPPVDAGRLRLALLPAPQGMRVVHGPETGAFGSLESTKKGLAAARQVSLARPECAGAAQLDAGEPALANAPAAVVAYASDRGSITQALVAMPSPVFPPPLPAQCADYTADVEGTRVTYGTRQLTMPRQGDESRAYLTTAVGGGQNAQVGSVVIRRGNVILSLLVVGRKVKSGGLFQLAQVADRQLAKISR
ncbi:hypothetical protein [Nonomuraea cavernae]|uniref:hypothetical protein n=1 Tax=Nonomuraea cavernae TaxID=2045107 RepID=UPI00166C3255|nr:hypothetical protein [Nonomuraea cavernae]MCA2186346.1 hypothetical protein [Nonomuraea cavernae]